MYSILSEEYPQEEDVSAILSYIFKKRINDIEYTVPDGNWNWKFGINGFENVEVGFMSGTGSVCDYIILKDGSPHLFVEATQTTESESRNTSFGQRATKFFVAKEYYPDIPFVYLYSQPLTFGTRSSIFCARLYKTHGIPVLYRGNCELDLIGEFEPFATDDEVMQELNSIPKRLNNTSLTLQKRGVEYNLSARLSKGANTDISSDPNIGMVTLISQTLKKLSATDVKVVVTNHGVHKSCSPGHKFMIANRNMNLHLEGFDISTRLSDLKDSYFKQLTHVVSEKCSTILFHVLAKSSGFEVLFHNHAGSARSKLVTSEGLVSVPKKVTIPDLVLKYDDTIYMVEGKVQSGYTQGLKQLDNLDDFVLFLTKYYPNCRFDKGLCLSVNGNTFQHDDVLFWLNSDGSYA